MTFDVLIDDYIVGIDIYGLKREIIQNKEDKDVLNNIGRVLKYKKHILNIHKLSTLGLLSFARILSL
jgi:hypothetical protein